MDWAGYVGRLERNGNTDKVWVRKAGCRRLFECVWDDNINIDLKDLEEKS
jgi:sarcosine oxidase delta subunit